MVGALLCLLSTTSLSQNSTNTLTIPERGMVSIVESVEILQADQPPHQINAVLQQEQWFENHQVSRLSLGFREGPVWLRFSVQNPEDARQPVMVHLPHSLLDTVELYQVLPRSPEPNAVPSLANQPEKQVAGDRLPFHERPIWINGNAFPAELPAQSISHFYLKVESSSSLILPIYLGTQTSFMEYLHDTRIAMGLFYGVALALLLYNLFIFVSVRETSFLLYVALVSANTLFWLVVDGLAFQYIWPNQPMFQYYAHLILLSLVMILSLQFTRYYLRIREYSQTLDNLMLGLIGLDVLALLSTGFLSIQSASIFLLMLTLVNCLVLLISSFQRFLSGYPPARFFLLAWGAYLCSVLFGVFTTLGLLDPVIPHQVLIKACSAAEMILLAFGLADYINRLKALSDSSVNQAEEASTQNLAKTEFLAKMSHEIRTPMNGVLGMAEILKSTELDEKQHHYVDTIYGSGQALLNVINDILDHSKVESGQLELDQVPFNLEHLVDESISIFSLKASEKGLSLMSSVRPGTPTLLKGDPTRLKQIIINLLSNATKFTDSGEIILRAHPTNHSTRERPQIRFEVQDTGVGIPPDGLEGLFKSYSASHSSVSRQFGGTGLGLSLCKQLVDLMHGDVGVESQVNEGSTFWFTATFDAAKEEEVQPVIRSKALHNIKLLVVDDHPTLFANIQEKATSWGMNVETALSGAQAIRKLEKAEDLEEPYDIILTDWDMPGMNGLELIEQLRNDIRFNHLDVVLMSSSRVMPDKTVLEKLRIHATLEKPFTTHQLHNTLAQVVSGAPAVSTANENDNSNQYGHLRVLVAEDNTVNQMVIRGVLKKLGITPKISNNGLEAVQAYKQARGQLDLILMDCDMPEMDGFEATSKIRAIQVNKKYPHLLIFALSAHVLEEYKMKAIQVGMDDFVPKPVEMKRLQAKLEEWREQFGEWRDSKAS